MTPEVTVDEASFGTLLRRFRVAAGLSQEELAERAHMSARGVSDLERGARRTPYRSTVMQLSEALELGDEERAALEQATGTQRAPASSTGSVASESDDPLLAIKLAAPLPRPALVERTRLIERLAAGLRDPLTLLSAPAGSGKTTLIGAWRATVGGDVPLAWVSLDAGDNDPARFWRYVLAALGRVHPHLSQTTEDLLASPQLPPRTSLLTRLINAITAANVDIVLALDDYHLIEHHEIHEAVGYLLDHLPPHLHLLISSRADPPLLLARMRASGAVTELRAADLRFTVEETTAFLNSTMGLSLSPDDVAALEARTEGWIAGLQLAGLSLQGRSPEDAASFITGFTGSHHHIVDYLLDEVLLRQPDEVQRFLLHTCILDRLCAPLCATVVDGEDPPAERIAASQELLETLERHNVFLIALDDERHWYRYHHLFADALRQRQRASIPDVSTLHRRASTWFEQQDLLEDAIGHALSGSWDDRAADLIQRAVERLTFRGETQTIATWLRALPETTLRSRPQLCMEYSWLLADMHDLDGSEEYLEHAEAVLDTAPKPTRWASMGSTGDERESLRALIRAHRAIVSVRRGDAARAMLHAQAALDGLDATNVGARSLAGVASGLAHLSQGAASDAAQAFGDVRAVSRATNMGVFVVLAAVGEASAQRMAGALDQARLTYEQAIAWSKDPSHSVLLVGSLYTGLADILCEQQLPDAALDYATQGLRLSNELGAARAERWIEWHICNLLVLARVKQAQGDVEGALDVVREAQEQLTGSGAISIAAILAAFEAQLHLARGDLDSAVGWLRSVDAQQAPLRFGVTPQVSVYATEHLAIAPIQVLIAQGRASRDPAPIYRALTLLDELQAKAERSDFAWLRAKALILRALARQGLGEMSAALSALDQALVLAQAGRFMRLFINEGSSMADLLRERRTDGANPDYAAALLAALEGQPPSDSEKAARPHGAESRGLRLTEPLTERELDVLRLLGVGQSTPEIARALYVEVNTVRTHVKHLYDKLGVHSRDQAVWRARELSLL